MPSRPPMIRDKDTIEFRLTEQSESRLPFVFVETLDEATLAERSPRVYEEAARDRRLIHIVNRSTESILGTAMVQPSTDGKRPLKAEVGGLAVHPGARGFGIASHLLKVMMVYMVKESGRDQPDEQYIGHVVEGNVASIDALLGAGFRSTGIVELHRDEIDAGIDHLIPKGGSAVRMESFAFDRAALDALILQLWTFVRDQQGVIARTHAAGDVHITLDFSQIIGPDYLEAEATRIGSLQRGRIRS
jgi:GNAT superfamily N-acetyltransferase